MQVETTTEIARLVRILQEMGLEDICLPEPAAEDTAPCVQITVPRVAGGVFDLLVTHDPRLGRVALRVFERTPSNLRTGDWSREVLDQSLPQVTFAIGNEHGHVWASCAGGEGVCVENALNVLEHLAASTRDWDDGLSPWSVLTNEMVEFAIEVAIATGHETKSGLRRRHPIGQRPVPSHGPLGLPPMREQL